MRRRTLLVALAALALTCLPTPANAHTWNVDFRNETNYCYKGLVEAEGPKRTKVPSFRFVLHAKTATTWTFETSFRLDAMFVHVFPCSGGTQLPTLEILRGQVRSHEVISIVEANRQVRLIRR